MENKRSFSVIKRVYLILSTGVAMCLFLPLSYISLIVILAAMIIVGVVLPLIHIEYPAHKDRYVRIGAVLLTLLTSLVGLYTFSTTWKSQDVVGSIAATLHVPQSILLLICGVLLCVVGSFAEYKLFAFVIVKLKRSFPEQRRSALIANTKKNWYFPISALAFFCVSATLTLGYIIGLIIVFGISLVIASQFPSIWKYIRKKPIAIQVISFLTAAGSCWGIQSSFYESWSISSKTQALATILPESVNISLVILLISIFGAINALFFVFFCMSILWDKIMNVIKNTGMFKNIKTAELIVYILLLVATFVLVTVSFSKTEAFYGTDYGFDVIYTSDSPSLVQGNAYLKLTHKENDLKQPLFAVFATPFVGIPYLLGKIMGASASVQAMLIDYVQVFILFLSFFILANMMKLDWIKRICFMLLSCSTYTYLLFSLMMEQYIVSFFWLVLCMYLICERKKPDQIVFWGASGTLITSMVLLPFMSDKSPTRSFKDWFVDIVKQGGKFILLMLSFCRFDIFFDLIAKASDLGRFTGKGLTIMEKLCQYTSFVRNCFIAPYAGANFTVADHASWQLDITTKINLIGVVILVLIVISAILNREKKSSLLAAGWVGLSVVMLFILGWGTKENGLVLYSLYFGWAFLVLLYQLVEKIENKLKVRFLLPLISIGCIIALSIINIPKIIELVDFAGTYFPL